MSKLTFSEQAWDEYLYWQMHDKKILKRINQLLADISRNGYAGIGKPEALKENLSAIGAGVSMIRTESYTAFRGI